MGGEERGRESKERGGKGKERKGKGSKRRKKRERRMEFFLARRTLSSFPSFFLQEIQVVNPRRTAYKP